MAKPNIKKSETARIESLSGAALVPLARLLARQAASEFVHQLANEENDGPENTER